MAKLNRSPSIVGGKAPDPGPVVLKDYQFINKLGQGTYANVFKAYKKNNVNNYVAIKCILLSSLSKSSQDNIVTEIEILKKVKSEYIVQLIDFLWDANYIYLIMEYCSGGDLSHFIRQRKRLPENIVRRFLQQIATAMKVLRELNICHTDLKPQNILLSTTKDPKLKIADFGFAQYLGNKDEATSLRGSPLYMAPEILLKHQYDARVDLWSIGIILFECLFGRAPYSSDTFAELAEKIKCDKPIEIPSTVDLSDECVDLLTRLLQRSPSHRITFDEFFSHAFVDLEHMPSPESYEKGLSLIRAAVERDEEGQFEKASQLYFEGLLYLVPHVQCESNVHKRRVLRIKVTEYMDRAELLRNQSRECEDDCIDAISNTTTYCNTREELLSNILSNNDSLSDAFAKSHAADEQMMAGNYNEALTLYKKALNVIVPFVKGLPSGPKREVLHNEASNWLRKGEEAKSCVAIQKLKMKDVAEALKKGDDLDEISSLGSNCSIQ